nr:non-homologous end-joining factor 1-like [Oncorhynchus nerka]
MYIYGKIANSFDISWICHNFLPFPFSLSLSLSLSLPQTVPQVCVRQGSLGFDSELQELYSAVTSYGNARKRKISERHAPKEDESTTEDRDPKHAASGTQPPGEEVNHGLDQGGRARTTDSETPNEEKTTVPMATAADRPSARPKKKKAKGLFG